MTLRRLGACAAAILLLEGGAPTPARASPLPTVVDRYPVSAQNGVVVYSRYRRVIRRYELVARRRGAVRPLPVEPQRRPFEADLGTDARGRMVATYARCPRPRSRGGCDLFVYSFRDRTERRLNRYSTARSSEFLPSMWNGQVGFVRRTGRGDPQIRLGARRLRAGPRSREEPAAVRSLDLGRAGLVFVWDYVPASCPGPEDKAGPSADAVLLDRRDGSQTMLAAGCNSALPTTGFINAVLDDGFAYFAYANYTVPGIDSRLRRVDLESGTVADSDRRLYDHVAVDGRRVFVGGTRTRPARPAAVTFELVSQRP